MYSPQRSRLLKPHSGFLIKEIVHFGFEHSGSKVHTNGKNFQLSLSQQFLFVFQFSTDTAKAVTTPLS